MLCTGAVAAATPPVFTDKFDAPSFYQLRDVYPNGGQAYCLPTSAADGVAWLSEHGYDLLPDRTDEDALVQAMAAKMNTDPTQGTPWYAAAGGLADFLDDYYAADRIRIESPEGRPDRQTYAWVREQVSRPDTVAIVARTIYLDLPPVGWGQWYKHALFLAGYDTVDPTLHLYDPLIPDPAAPRVHPIVENVTTFGEYEFFNYYMFDLPVTPPETDPPVAGVEIRWDGVMTFSIAADGDANHDAVVDALDLAAMATHYGDDGCGWAEGDFTGDGRVDVFDLSRLAMNYDGAAGGKSVPAPPVALVLLIGVAGILRRRRP